MSKIREKVFITVISNVAIFLAVAAVFAVSFSNKIISVINPEGYKPYYHGNLETKNVSLMINVYWGTEYIDDMLDILNRHNVKCTFFVGGSWAQKNPEMLLKIKDNGHEIGNHGQFHKDHKNINAEKNREEIETCGTVVEKITGVKPNLFAPPSGSFSETTLKIAAELGYKTIMWSKDTIDWRDKDKTLAYNRATKNVKGGDLILMHPTQHTKDALEDILKHYEETGFTAVTVSQNIA